MTQIYATKAQLAELTGRDWKTVHRRVNEMRDLIGTVYDADRDFAGEEISIKAYLHHLNHVRPQLITGEPLTPFNP